MGDDLTIADIAIVPWIRGVIDFCQAASDIGLDRTKHVADWVERCSGRLAYQRGKGVCAPPED